MITVLDPTYLILVIVSLLFGSFTNVLIYRISTGLNIAFPPSHCPNCKHQLRWWENIPIVSFIILKAKCSQCKVFIPWNYPLIEFAVLLISLPFISNSINEYSLIIIVISITVALGIIDQKYHELPHVLSFSGVLIILAYSLFQKPIFYETITDFRLIPSFLTALYNFGLGFFAIDAFTHLMNIIYFRKRALSISPSALTLRNKFLEKNISYVYALIIFFLIYSFCNQKIFLLNLFGLTLGFSYLINEILLDFFFNENKEVTTEIAGESVLGGGDSSFLAFISTLLGFTNAVSVFFLSFYVALVFWIIRKLVFKDKTLRYIPLGAALAISFIAVMMWLYIN